MDAQSDHEFLLNEKCKHKIIDMHIDGVMQYISDGKTIKQSVNCVFRRNVGQVVR